MASLINQVWLLINQDLYLRDLYIWARLYICTRINNQYIIKEGKLNMCLIRPVPAGKQLRLLLFSPFQNWALLIYICAWRNNIFQGRKIITRKIVEFFQYCSNIVCIDYIAEFFFFFFLLLSLLLFDNMAQVVFTPDALELDSGKILGATHSNENDIMFLYFFNNENSDFDFMVFFLVKNTWRLWPSPGM